MVDPVSGGIGKASKQMMQELQKQMSEQVQGGEGPEKAKFNDLMVQDVQQNQDLTKTQGVNDPTRAQSVLKTAQVNATQKVDGKNIDIKGVEADSSARTGLKKMLNKMVEGQTNSTTSSRWRRAANSTDSKSCWRFKRRCTSSAKSST